MGAPCSTSSSHVGGGGGRHRAGTQTGGTGISSPRNERGLYRAHVLSNALPASAAEPAHPSQGRFRNPSPLRRHHSRAPPTSPWVLSPASLSAPRPICTVHPHTAARGARESVDQTWPSPGSRQSGPWGSGPALSSCPCLPPGPGIHCPSPAPQPPACSRGLCTDPVPPGPASPSFSFDCLSTLALSGHLGSGRARTGTGATFSAVVSTWSCALKCHWLPPPSWVIREASRVHSSLGPRPARHDLSGVTETPLPEAPCHERPCCRAQLGLFLAAGSGPHVLVSARSPLQPGCSSSFLHGLSPNSHLGGPSSP